MKVTSTHKWTVTGILAFIVLLGSSVAAWEALRLPRWEWRQDAIDTQRGNVEKHLRLAGYSEQTSCYYSSG